LSTGWAIQLHYTDCLILATGNGRGLKVREDLTDLGYSSGSRSYTASWILLTFLGIFGILRFYLGKWITG